MSMRVCIISHLASQGVYWAFRLEFNHITSHRIMDGNVERDVRRIILIFRMRKQIWISFAIWNRMRCLFDRKDWDGWTNWDLGTGIP